VILLSRSIFSCSGGRPGLRRALPEDVVYEYSSVSPDAVAVRAAEFQVQLQTYWQTRLKVMGPLLVVSWYGNRFMRGLNNTELSELDCFCSL